MHNNNVLAVDIGRKYIKLVQGKTSQKGISVISCGMCPTPANSFVDGNISDRSDIVKSISELLASKKIKCGSVMFGIKGLDVITRHIEMPILPDKQLKQAVMLEMQQYLPMDPNEYVMDSKKLNRMDTREKRAYNVLLVAAPKKKINDYYYIADKLGLNINSIDIFANSTTRLFEQKDMFKGPISPKKCIAFVDIGYESSLVTLIEDSKLYFEREIGFGVRDIDNMLKKAYACSDEEVEALRRSNISINAYKNASDSKDPRIYFANNNARQLIDTFIDNIIKVFDFYTSSGFGRLISNLYISGGGSMINGLAEYIRTSANIETELYDAGMLKNVFNIDQELNNNIVLYLNCISLLLRKD